MFKDNNKEIWKKSSLPFTYYCSKSSKLQKLFQIITGKPMEAVYSTTPLFSVLFKVNIH